MAEFRKELKVYQLKYRCDSCVKGFMKVYTDTYGAFTVKGNNPIQYLHTCSNCGKKQYLKGKYPRKEYK